MEQLALQVLLGIGVIVGCSLAITPLCARLRQPGVVGQIVVGLAFGWLLNGRFGLLAAAADALGWPRPAMLEGEGSAILAVIAAGLWPQIAYCAILYLAGLAVLDSDLTDAGRLDGARGLRLLRHVVLPQMRPVTLIALVVSSVGALRAFDLVAIMTDGGPYGSSTVLGYYAWQATFEGSRYGYGAAIATVLFFLVALGTAILLTALLRRDPAA
jgi:multiple sugar transport system permease protein